MGVEDWKPLVYVQGYVEGSWEFYGGYDDIVMSFGYEIVLETSHGDYQGDLFYLLKDGDKYGFLNVGYGSCSGCDVLHSSIDWRDSAAGMVDRLLSVDWPGRYYGASAEVVDFVKRSIEKIAGGGWKENLLTSDVRLMVANVLEVEAGILADAFDESGFYSTARELRGGNSDDVIELLKKVFQGE